MKKPRLKSSTRVLVCFEKDTYETLKILAKNQDTSMSEIVRKALYQYMKNLDNCLS